VPLIAIRSGKNLGVHAQSKEGDDFDRQIPSSSQSLLEMEGPLHGVCVNLTRRPW
jgi:hypothetical protein